MPSSDLFLINQALSCLLPVVAVISGLESPSDTREIKIWRKKKVKEEAEEEKVSFFKLFSFADNLDIGLMSIGTICAIANGVAMPCTSLIFGELINTFGGSDPSHVVSDVSKVSLMFVYLAIAACFTSFIQVSCWMVTGERQAARIRSLYLKTLLGQDVTFFDMETSTGEVIGRMSGDTILIQDAMGEKVAKFIQLVSTFLGGFIIAFVRGWLLALVMMACIPLIVISVGATAIFMSKMVIRGQAAYAEAGSVVEQTIGAIRTVASFIGEKVAIEKYDTLIGIAYASSLKQGLASGIGVGMMMLIIFSSYALAVWYGSKLIIEKGYNGGQVVNVMIAVMTGGMSLGQASPSLNSIADGRVAAYKMFQTIKRQPLIDAYSHNGVVPNDILGDIELKNVYFSYPARPDIQIFSGFSLHVPSGTTAALVGQSGSGKSTVISLIERFYDPQEGEVLIDGKNLKDFRLGWIREKIGLVSPEPVLFTTTIRGNVAYGKENATNEEIRTAIELANAAKFIHKLPKGLDTMVGEHGTHLSGGQKQRIAIARAILKNPKIKILLLDEATSALDAESERIVQDALVRIMTNRTTVVVAHRLTTIRNADTIAVVHKGKIVEQGSHFELTKDPEGAYSQLIRLQEGDRQAENVSPADPDYIELTTEKSTISRSHSQRLSMRRSISRHSSGARHSISLSLGIPVGITVSATGGDNDIESEERDGEPKRKVSIMRLASMNKPESLILVLGFIVAAVHGVLFPLFGLLLSTTIKIFYEPLHELQKDSKFWAMLFVGLGCVSLVFIPLEHYLFGVAGGNLIQRIRSWCFAKVVYQEISWFDDPANSSGEIGARLSGDASTIRRLVGDSLAQHAQLTAVVTAGLVIAFTTNWVLAFIVLALLPLIGLQTYVQMRFLNGFSTDAKIMYEEASQIANDAVGSIRTVASFCAERRVMDLYENKCAAPRVNAIRQGLISGAGYGFSFLIFYSVNALIFYVGAVLVQQGKAEFEEIFKVGFSLLWQGSCLSGTSVLAPDSNKARDAAASIFEILDRIPQIDSSSDEGTTLSDVQGDVDFKRVSFRYPTRPDVQIFRDFCLVIPSGKTVALVGESGSGKSTVISLLQRFYDPDSGCITLDGVEIQKFKLSWLRQQTGLVSQEPVLFNETIRANVAYGKQGATEEEIIAATKAANAHNFISGLPQGCDTLVGERGVQLSGGQKQRIAIARAIIKDPKILLLDEATSALDAESERVVQEALDRVMVNRTTIVVAHRLSTIKGADIIAVMKNGVIAEKGRHETLMKITGGVYASLAQQYQPAS